MLNNDDPPADRTAPPVDIYFGPDDLVDPNRLVPGARARRWTDNAPAGQLDTAVPCCGRIARLRQGFAHVPHLVLRTTCGLTYEVGLVDENDGGWGAVFTVREDQPVIARRRAAGWLSTFYRPA